MYVMLYRPTIKAEFRVIGIFFTKKQAKKARDCLIKYDQKRYPEFPYRAEQTKSAYRIVKQKLWKVKKHEYVL